MSPANLLVIMSDGHNPKVMGARGHPIMQTPKYIHWVNRGRAGELDELYDLDKDPWELENLIASPAYARTRSSLRRELKRLVPEALDL